MKNDSEIKSVETKFPNVLHEQIKKFNELYEMIQFQKHLLENGDFEQLFSTRERKDQIVEIIKDQGEEIVELQNSWYDHKEEIPHSVHQELNGLVGQLSEMIHKVLMGENLNYHIIEHTQEYLDNLESDSDNSLFDDMSYY